jgi:predicted phage terminase large subunit-like protein
MFAGETQSASTSSGAQDSYELVPLLEFIPMLSPRFVSPWHLRELGESFEQAAREPVFVVADPPPRHGKTELVKHAIVHRLLWDPTTRVGYASYDAKYAYKRSREIRRLYELAGGFVDPGAAAVADWRTGVEQGGLWASSVGGPWTGEGFDLIVLDDTLKGHEKAESGLEREKIWDWYISDLRTRLEPGGSIICVNTRWHIDDFPGRLITWAGYRHIHLPAINSRGQALWPERWPLSALEEIRRGGKGERGMTAYVWEALYLGTPFAKGGRVFHAEQYYDELPKNLRIACGVDLAYSKKTHADWSVIVVLGIDDVYEKTYVLDVIREQDPAPEFARTIRAVLEKHRALEARWYYAGAELGIADFIKSLDVELEAVPATADKFVRAQPVAAAWNSGNVLVPRESPWLNELLLEITSFTGVKDLHDDQVDALAAAYDSATKPGWAQAMERLRAAEHTAARSGAEANVILAAARAHAGMSLPELSARTGRDTYSLSAAEAGLMKVNSIFLEDVLTACGLPVNWTPPVKK